MFKFIKKAFAIAAFVLLVANTSTPNSKAHAVAGVGDTVYDPTAYAVLVKQLADQIKQARADFSTFSGRAQDYLPKLKEMLDNVEGITYRAGEIAKVLKENHPGWEEYAFELNLEEEFSKLGDFKRWKKWRDQVRSNLEFAFNQQQYADEFLETSELTSLNMDIVGAHGASDRNTLLKVNAESSVKAIVQLQNLRKQLMNQAQLMNSFMVMNEEKETRKHIEDMLLHGLDPKTGEKFATNDLSNTDGAQLDIPGLR